MTDALEEGKKYHLCHSSLPEGASRGGGKMLSSALQLLECRSSPYPQLVLHSSSFSRQEHLHFILLQMKLSRNLLAVTLVFEQLWALIPICNGLFKRHKLPSQLIVSVLLSLHFSHAIVHLICKIWNDLLTILLYTIDLLHAKYATL